MSCFWDLDDFIACYSAGNRAKRKETERFRKFAYADLIKRDKINLHIFWLKDDSLDDPDLLPPPDEIAAEIVESSGDGPGTLSESCVEPPARLDRIGLQTATGKVTAGSAISGRMLATLRASARST